MGWTLSTKLSNPIGTKDEYFTVTYVNWAQVDCVIRDKIANLEDLAGITIRYKP